MSEDQKRILIKQLREDDLEAIRDRLEHMTWLFGWHDALPILEEAVLETYSERPLAIINLMNSIFGKVVPEWADHSSIFAYLAKGPDTELFEEVIAWSNESDSGLVIEAAKNPHSRSSIISGLECAFRERNAEDVGQHLEALTIADGWKACLGELLEIMDKIGEVLWYPRHIFLLRSLGLAMLEGFDGNLVKLLKRVPDSDDFSKVKENIEKRLAAAVKKQVESNGSTLFFELDELSSSHFAPLVLPILQRRSQEFVSAIEEIEKQIQAQPVKIGKIDARPLVQTAYGYQTLAALKFGLLIQHKKADRVLRSAKKLMTKLDPTTYRKDVSAPVTISDEMRRYAEAKLLLEIGDDSGYIGLYSLGYINPLPIVGDFLQGYERRRERRELPYKERIKAEERIAKLEKERAKIARSPEFLQSLESLGMIGNKQAVAYIRIILEHSEEELGLYRDRPLYDNWRLSFDHTKIHESALSALNGFGTKQAGELALLFLSKQEWKVFVDYSGDLQHVEHADGIAGTASFSSLMTAIEIAAMFKPKELSPILRGMLGHIDAAIYGNDLADYIVEWYIRIEGENAVPDLLEHLEFSWEGPLFTRRYINRGLFNTMKNIGKTVWPQIEKALWDLYFNWEYEFRVDALSFLEDLDVRPWEDLAEKIEGYAYEWEHPGGYDKDPEQLEYIAKHDKRRAQQVVFRALALNCYTWDPEVTRKWVEDLSFSPSKSDLQHFLDTGDRNTQRGVAAYISINPKPAWLPALESAAIAKVDTTTKRIDTYEEIIAIANTRKASSLKTITIWLSRFLSTPSAWQYSEGRDWSLFRSLGKWGRDTMLTCLPSIKKSLKSSDVVERASIIFLIGLASLEGGESYQIESEAVQKLAALFKGDHTIRPQEVSEWTGFPGDQYGLSTDRRRKLRRTFGNDYPRVSNEWVDRSFALGESINTILIRGKVDESQLSEAILQTKRPWSFIRLIKHRSDLIKAPEIQETFSKILPKMTRYITNLDRASWVLDCVEGVKALSKDKKLRKKIDSLST